MTNEEIIALNREYVFFTWAVQSQVNPIPAARSEGVYFWDADGKRYLEEYLERHPWDAPTKYHLGMISAREGDEEAARRLLSGIPEFKAGIPKFTE